MDQVLSQTLRIIVGETDEQGNPVEGAEEFILRVPTPIEKARLGVREASIRRTLDPMGAGWASGLDDDTFFLIRGMVILETLLEKANVRWPYSESKDGKGNAVLQVDITKFPPGKEASIQEVGREFQDALDRFHGERSGHKQPTVPQAVDGGSSSEAL